MNAARRWQSAGVIAVAAVLNLILLVGPAVVFRGGAVLATPQVVFFLTLATLFFLADASTFYWSAYDRPITTAVDLRQQRLAALTGGLLWGTLAFSCYDSEPHVSPLRLAAGGILMLFGSWLRWSSICQLQTQFNSAAIVSGPHRQLVVDGIFRVLRHPSEVGLLMFASGAAITLGSWSAAVGIGALFATSLCRIRWEDEQLAIAWPAEFADYRRRVPALVPFRTH